MIASMPGAFAPASSEEGAQALDIVAALQQRFVGRLEALSQKTGGGQAFRPVSWLRDGGRHGGGLRYETADGPVIGRGSVNVSQVHYDDMPEKKLASATAISTIIHPVHPHAPSVHIHVSRTEMRDGSGYWRIMADLNPAIADASAAARFLAALQSAAPAQFEAAKAQGERYFFIPALGRTRGVAHFYLEGYATDDAAADSALAQSVGAAAIDSYSDILEDALSAAGAPTPEDADRQLAYHTLYFFQVLTLDRGTTSGLLVHDENDIGILGSLPPRVDRDLLACWLPRMQPPQDELLTALLAALPDGSPCVVDAASKARLAAVVRAHYRAHPEAIAMQASAETTPPTVQNHA